MSDLVMASALQIADNKASSQFVSLPKRPPRELRADERGWGSYLGSIPEYGVDTAGVRLAGVMDESPAALAGLRAGDVIIRLANANIQTIEDLTVALGAQKPGDEVEIVVLRAGSAVKFKATLRTRGSTLGRG